MNNRGLLSVLLGNLEEKAAYAPQLSPKDQEELFNDLKQLPLNHEDNSHYKVIEVYLSLATNSNISKELLSEIYVTLMDQGTPENLKLFKEHSVISKVLSAIEKREYSRSDLLNLLSLTVEKNLDRSLGIRRSWSRIIEENFEILPSIFDESIQWMKGKSPLEAYNLTLNLKDILEEIGDQGPLIEFNKMVDQNLFTNLKDHLVMVKSKKQLDLMYQEINQKNKMYCHRDFQGRVVKVLEKLLNKSAT